MTAAADNLRTMPKQLGDWQMTEEMDMGELTEEMLECAGHVTRRYVNRKSGARITMFIIVGPPGPIAVHTPEICFSSRDYEKYEQKRTQASFDSDEAEPHLLWQTAFRSKRITTDILDVYYAWSTGGTWQASRECSFPVWRRPITLQNSACRLTKHRRY